MIFSWTLDDYSKKTNSFKELEELTSATMDAIRRA